MQPEFLNSGQVLPDYDCTLPQRLIGSVPVNKTAPVELLQHINEAVEQRKQLIITYAHAHTILLAEETKAIAATYRDFTIVHPDGVGVYLASKVLYKENGFSARMTGSDFYPELLTEMKARKRSVFFFGDTEETLGRLPEMCPGLSIAGTHSGYNFDADAVCEKINEAAPDVLLVGIGAPLQEIWVVQNRERLNVPVIICVGDGIKIFAGTKVRGPVLMRTLGLEWLARLLNSPKQYASRYLIGIPNFISRIFQQKLSQ